MRKRGNAIQAVQTGDEIRQPEPTDTIIYEGPLGEVVRHGRSFAASRGGTLVGTTKTFREAILALLDNVEQTSKLANAESSKL
jgi:hypothetical protein